MCKYLNQRLFFNISAFFLENILTFTGEDVILGADADIFEEEQYFKDLIVITNYNGKRNSNYRKKPLIFHGGLEIENAERKAYEGVCRFRITLYAPHPAITKNILHVTK